LVLSLDSWWHPIRTLVLFLDFFMTFNQNIGFIFGIIKEFDKKLFSKRHVFATFLKVWIKFVFHLSNRGIMMEDLQYQNPTFTCPWFTTVDVKNCEIMDARF
jgi:hypothetical protein